MSDQVKFYQVGSFAVGNRLLDLEDRSVQSGAAPYGRRHKRRIRGRRASCGAVRRTQDDAGRRVDDGPDPGADDGPGGGADDGAGGGVV
mgnify:CR=1 FL=1